MTTPNDAPSVGDCLEYQTLSPSANLYKVAGISINTFPSNTDHIDEKTRVIINGYIQTAEKLLDPEFLTNIPSEINQITLYFVDDHFMIHRGSFQWKISGSNKMKKIRTAAPDDIYTSSVFDMCNLKWIAKLTPNGCSEYHFPSGSVGLYIELTSISPKWDYALIQQTIICHQTNTIFHRIRRYNANTMG